MKTPTQEITETIVARKAVQHAAEMLKDATPSRERSLAITKLQEAVHWLQEDHAQRTHAVARATPTNAA